MRIPSMPASFAAFFLIAVSVAVLAGELPRMILAMYVATSLATFLAYALDKSAARKNQWRIRESTLHLLSLAGGWPGAFFGQTLLRHKTRKQPFVALLWITVILNCGAFWLFVFPPAYLL